MLSHYHTKSGFDFETENCWRPYAICRAISYTKDNTEIFRSIPESSSKVSRLGKFNDEFSCLDPFWMIFLHQKSTESRLKTWSRNRRPMNRYNQTNIISTFLLYVVKPFLMVKGENVYLSRIIHTWPSKDTPCQFAKRCVYLPLAMGVAGLTIPMGSLSAIRFLERYLESVSQCKAS